MRDTPYQFHSMPSGAKGFNPRARSAAVMRGGMSIAITARWVDSLRF